MDGNTAAGDRRESNGERQNRGGSANVLLPALIAPGCIMTLLDQKAPVGIVLLILNDKVSHKDRLSGTLHDTGVSLSLCLPEANARYAVGCKMEQAWGSARGLEERFTADLPTHTIGSKA